MTWVRLAVAMVAIVLGHELLMSDAHAGVGEPHTSVMMHDTGAEGVHVTPAAEGRERIEELHREHCFVGHQVARRDTESATDRKPLTGGIGIPLPQPTSELQRLLVRLEQPVDSVTLRVLFQVFLI